jgi:hypothetical protein
LYDFFWVIHQRQTPVNHSAESTQHSEHGESLKSGTFNHLTPELNPSAQRCLTRFFTGDFAF